MKTRTTRLELAPASTAIVSGREVGRRDLIVGLGLAGLAASFGVGVLAACRRTGTDPPDRGRILSDLSSIVFVPAYAAASSDAKAMETGLVGFKDGPTASGLAAAREAWKAARRTWKKTDAFLFGPAADLAIVGGVIDTAADLAKVEALVSATTPLDAAAIAKLGANERGFPAIEALLFDPAKDDAATLALFEQEGGRRAQLVALLAADLVAKIDAVRDAWAPGAGDYGGQLARAGRGSTVFPAERQGIDAVVNGLIAAAEVLIALRLAKPLGIDKTPAVPAPELVESPRSDVSIDDILAVLDGIDEVYFGHSGALTGLPLADAVADRSPSADDRMRLAMEKAKEAVRAIQGPLRTAVVDRRDSVVAAHVAVREVKRTLTTDVAGALGTSVGFGVTDGD